MTFNAARTGRVLRRNGEAGHVCPTLMSIHPWTPGQGWEINHGTTKLVLKTSLLDTNTTAAPSVHLYYYDFPVTYPLAFLLAKISCKLAILPANRACPDRVAAPTHQNFWLSTVPRKPPAAPHNHHNTTAMAPTSFASAAAASNAGSARVESSAEW